MRILWLTSDTFVSANIREGECRCERMSTRTQLQQPAAVTFIGIIATFPLRTSLGKVFPRWCTSIPAIGTICARE